MRVAFLKDFVYNGLYIILIQQTAEANITVIKPLELLSHTIKLRKKMFFPKVSLNIKVCKLHKSIDKAYKYGVCYDLYKQLY